MRFSLHLPSLMLLIGFAAVTSGHAQGIDSASPGVVAAPAPTSDSLVLYDVPVGLGRSAADAPLARFAAANDAEVTSAAGALLPMVLLRPVDPGTARQRAYLFPGGGHFYTGETLRGAALLGVAAGSLIAGALLSSSGGSCEPTAPGDGCEYDPNTHEYRSGSSNRTPLYVGAAVAAGSWIYGIVDARNSAARMNRRNGVALGPVTAHPEPLVGVARDGRTEVGMRVRLAR